MTDTVSRPKKSSKAADDSSTATAVDPKKTLDAAGVPIPTEKLMEKFPYEVRPLKTKDAYRIGRMIGRVIGDQRLQQAILTQETSLIIGSAVGVILDRIPRDLQLVCADMIGITRDYKEERRKEMDEAEKEDRDELTEYELRTQMDNEIVDEYGETHPATTGIIVSKVLEEDDFEYFLSSIRLAATVGGKAFSKLGMSISSDTE